MSGLEGYWESFIQGHVHRAGIVYKTAWSKLAVGIENPCLCRLDPEYIGRKATNWQSGFTSIEWFGDNGLFDVDQHIIFGSNGKRVCRFEGKTYTQDRDIYVAQ